MDLAKIQVITEWLKPHSVTALRGFLGLAGYYCKFIKEFGQLAAPLTSMLPRNSFCWEEIAKLSFDKLKQALVAALVLQLLTLSSCSW